MKHRYNRMEQIQDLLKAYPEGLNIKEIAVRLQIHRNQVTKHLGILQSQGYVTSRKYCTALIYSLSTRIPVAPLLAYSMDPVVIIDSSLIIADCNPQFTDLLSIPRGKCVGKSIADIRKALLLDQYHMDLIKSILQCEVEETTVRISRMEPLFAAMVSYLPAIFVDGRPGVALVIRDITGAVALENQLKELEVKYEALHSTLGGFVIDLDHKGAITSANEQYCAYIGKTCRDILDHGELPFTFSDDRTQVSTLLSTLHQERPAVSADTRSIDQDGDIRWERWDIHALLSKEGAVIGYRMTGHEITSFKRTEEQLKNYLESLEKLVRERTETMRSSNTELLREMETRKKIESQLKLTQYAMDESAEMILWFNKKGRVVYANRASCRTLGYSGDEFVHLKIWEVINLADEGSSEASPDVFFTNIGGKDEPVQIRGTLREKNGAVIPVDILFNQVEYAEKSLTLCFARDITAQVKAEHRVRESETTYRLLVETLQEGVWAIDAEGYTTFANPHMAEMLGYTVDEMQGKHLFSFMDEKVVDSAKRKIERRREGISEDHEFEFTHRDGSHIIASLKTGPIRDGEGNYLGAIAGVTDITGRKRTEESLRESEEKYRELADSITNVFFAMDRELRYTFWNKASETLTGIAAKDAIGSSIYDIFPDETGVIAAGVYLDVLQTQQSTSFIQQRQLKDRDYFFEISVYPSQRGVSVFVKDITEQKRMEKAVQRVNNYHRALIEASLDPLVTISHEGTINDVNEATVRITGYSREELIGTDFSGYFTDPERAHAGYEKVFLDGSITDYKLTVRHRDGQVTPVHYNAVVYRDESGAVSGVFAAARDITGRTQAEEELQESEERYRTVVNAITETLSVIDSEGKFLFANLQATRNMSGGSLSDITGRNIRDFVSPDIADQLIENYRRTIASGQPFAGEVKVILGGKEWWFYNHLIPFTFRPGEQTCVLSISFDITDQKRTDEILDLARKKLHVLNEITVNEITEAVFAQRGYLELAKRLNKDSALESYFDRQTQNIEKISAILRFCSNYQNLGASAPRWHDLHQTFLLALSHLTMPALTRNIDLDGLEIYADPLLEKVLVILVENVLFYAPTATMLSLNYRETGEELVITLEDDGPGIPIEEKEKIFERGYGKKIGLGLFLAREILEVTGMSIREVGIPGEGARFEMKVPEGIWRVTGEGD